MSTNQVAYYDSRHRLVTMLSTHVAERYVARGIATAVRAKGGAILRLYRRSTDRVYSSIGAAVGAMHAGPSQTTTRVRDDGGVLIAVPKHRDHRKADPGWPGARHVGDPK